MNIVTRLSTSILLCLNLSIRNLELLHKNNTVTALDNVSSCQHHTHLRKYIPILFVTVFMHYVL